MIVYVALKPFRIKITVSANRFIGRQQIEDFVRSKADFIQKAKKEFSQKRELPKMKYFDEAELKQTILNLCQKVYPYYKEKGIAFPNSHQALFS